MKKPSTRISTLIAVSSGLATLPAAALELGEANVNSSLGHPLRVSIAYALGPNEAISADCVTLQSGMARDGLPAAGPASLTVADGIIAISGKAALREPLVSMRVNVRCPYTAQLSRDYLLFIDPAGQEPAQPAAATTAAPQSAATVAPATVRRAPAANRVVSRQAIGQGTRHRVQPSETLSEIAQRIDDRPVGLWAAVAAIFDANPDAFIDADPNRLKAGSWLDIPDFAARAEPSSSTATVFAPASPAPEDVVTAVPVATVADAEPVDTVPEPAAELLPEPVAGNPYANAMPDTFVSIPDTRIDAPVVTGTSPNVPAASVRSRSPETPQTNWLLWLAGSGIAIIAALLFFGRLVRERFASSPIGAIAPPQRRRSDAVARHPIPESDIEVVEIAAAPRHESLALDADLIVGTGLRPNDDVDIAQDFGFAATSALDLELPEEMSSGVYDSPQTDIIPPLNLEMQSILDSEVLPESIDADDEYDMSVVIDATKMPMPEDITERDLEAIAVDTSDESLITGDYTVDHEVDYTVLEQDYEDEFTATQALNNEITRAAAELAARMDEEFDNGDDDDTREMSLASITALDITARLPANNDDLISDLDDTGVNEALTANMKNSDKTVEMPGDDRTLEMPARKGRSA